MDIQSFITHLMNEAIYITIIVSLPAIAASLIVGLAVALFSATTQIQEQTLSFAPKMVAVYVVLAATSGWVGSLLLAFTSKCLSDFSTIVR